MIVAAAKAWQFEPAMKDGHPVKYVLRLPVAHRLWATSCIDD